MGDQEVMQNNLRQIDNGESALHISAEHYRWLSRRTSDRGGRMEKFYAALKEIRGMAASPWHVDARHLAKPIADALSLLDDEVASVEAAARDAFGSSDPETK